MVQCAKLGKEAEGLDRPPLPGELGRRIYESVSREAWQQWLRHQTILINENRLSMVDPRHRAFLEEQMRKFLFEDSAEMPGAFVPPKES
jgi:Fe-S cluster biosynthesis and repair protein YggX